MVGLPESLPREKLETEMSDVPALSVSVLILIPGTAAHAPSTRKRKTLSPIPWAKNTVVIASVSAAAMSAGGGVGSLGKRE
jgi:hypothetical protein